MDTLLQPPATPSGAGNEDPGRGICFSRITCAGSAGSLHTATELIVARADASKKNMGLTRWEAAPQGKIIKSDVSVPKNYLNTEEVDYLEQIVSIYLDFAELQSIRKIPMSMQDWAR
ncbi:MAG: RhuM family protein [Pigmentiphaga sp.]